MMKRILVGIGGTPYTLAEVRHAIELATAHNAEITGVTIVDLGRLADVGPVPIGGSAAAAELVQHRMAITQSAIEESINQFRSECERVGLGCRIIAEAGDPFEELTSLWRYHDLTVLAVRSLFEYGVVRDPQDMLIQLIAKGVRPILAVAPAYRPIRRVLIAYNGSMESAKAMKQFALFNLWPDAQIRLICADRSEDEARMLLHDAAQYLAVHGYTVETFATPDDPNEQLLAEAARWQADLIVMGATARARIFRHVLGDTALHLVKHSEIPLFMTQ